MKLARELARKATGRTLYVLDEPTTGLHFTDIEVLLPALIDLRDQGNTIVVIEHNLDVVACADWVIDLGPEGGEGGGEIVAAGRPSRSPGRALAHGALPAGRARARGPGGEACGARLTGPSAVRHGDVGARPAAAFLATESCVRC